VIAALCLALLQGPSPIERWRESIELDLPAEVVREGLSRVTGAGDLASEGEAIALVARALAATGAEDRAASLLLGAKPSDDSRGWVAVARARLALVEDDLAQARALLLADPRADPAVRYSAIPECWLLAGRALARGGEIARAAPLLERFLAMSPLDAEAPSAWHALVLAAMERGDEAGAAELRAKAVASAQWTAFYRTRRLQVRESPDEPLPRLGIAELFLAVGEHARAEACARGLIARFPYFCRGFEVLGRAERSAGDFEAARATLERGVACDNGAARTILELARVLAELGEVEESAARYARYKELGGTEPLDGR
jgi:tetratricopeptide (TPR) repeat protein